MALLSAAASAFAVVIVGRRASLTDFGTVNFEGIALFVLGRLLTPGLVRLFCYNGLNKLGASVNSSIFSVYSLYAALLVTLFLNESLPLQNWIGVVSIAFGVICVQLNFRATNNEDKSLTKNLIFPALGGFALSVSAILRKAALDIFNALILGVAVAYSCSFLVYAVMLALSEPRRKELSLKRDLRLFWLAGVGQALSWILSFYALSTEQISIITPLLSIEPLFVVFPAYLYMREQERLSFKLVTYVILKVIGVVFITTTL